MTMRFALHSQGLSTYPLKTYFMLLSNSQENRIKSINFRHCYVYKLDLNVGPEICYLNRSWLNRENTHAVGRPRYKENVDCWDLCLNNAK